MSTQNIPQCALVDEYTRMDFTSNPPVRFYVYEWRCPCGHEIKHEFTKEQELEYREPRLCDVCSRKQ